MWRYHCGYNLKYSLLLHAYVCFKSLDININGLNGKLSLGLFWVAYFLLVLRLHWYLHLRYMHDSSLLWRFLTKHVDYTVQKAEQVENQGAIRLFGVMPVIFILGGFLPQYYEIFRKVIKNGSDKIVIWFKL